MKIKKTARIIETDILRKRKKVHFRPRKSKFLITKILAGADMTSSSSNFGSYTCVLFFRSAIKCNLVIVSKLYLKNFS